MLLQSSIVNGQCTLELLPALPQAWSEGSVSGLRARGGYEVSMTWKDGKLTRAAVKSTKKGPVTLLYNGKAQKIKMKAGEVRTIAGE
jgi:alpha-L-fucosidase 2